MRTTLVRLLVAGALAAAGACGATSLAPSAAHGDPTGSTWVLREGEGPSGPVLDDQDARVTLRIDEDAGELGGVSACNHYGGSVSLGDGSIEIEGLSQTDMGCEPAIMGVETRYLEAIRVVDAFAVDGDTLELTGREARLTFDRQPDAPTTALLDTVWRLESVISGAGDDAAVSQATDPAELRLGDGTLELTTSCVRADAEWIAQGAELRITSASYDYADPDAACLHEDPEQQRILEVFDDAFTAEVDGDRLTVRGTRHDTGLQLRAAD